METFTDNESANLDDSLCLATWNQPRSLRDLRSFVTSHDAALDVEDFDFS